MYTDLDMPVDDQNNILEDIRIGNPKLTYKEELEKRTDAQRNERGRESANDDQEKCLEGIRIDKPNQTHDRQWQRRAESERDTYSSELEAEKDFQGDRRRYLRQRNCMEFQDNEDRPFGSRYGTDECKTEDVRTYETDRSIERHGIQGERPNSFSDIRSNGSYFDQHNGAREGNDRHVDELNLHIDGVDNKRLNGRNSNKSPLDERTSLHGGIHTDYSNSSYDSRHGFNENRDMHQSHYRDFSINPQSKFGDHERNLIYGERKNNESPNTFYEDRKSYNERDGINSCLNHERAFSIYRHEVKNDAGYRFLERSSKRGSSHGPNYDHRERNKGQKYNREREIKRARHEHIRGDEREHENLLHVRVDDEDMFLPRRNSLNPVKDYNLGGQLGRNDAVIHERNMSNRDSEIYEASRQENALIERRVDPRSFDNQSWSSRPSRYDHERDPRGERRKENGDERGFDDLRYDGLNHIPDSYSHTSEGVPRVHMKNSDNGYGDGNSNSCDQYDRDLYDNEKRDHLSVEDLQRGGQNGISFDESFIGSDVQRKMHDEELRMHTERREMIDVNVDPEVEGNRYAQSGLIDETFPGNHCPAELLPTQGGDHASRKRKRDLDSKIVKKTNRKRKSRSDDQKRIRTNEHDMISSSSNDDQRFITEEYIEKANHDVLETIGTEIVKAALNQPLPVASFEYLCNNTYQGREFETKYCLKTFVHTMFKETAINIKEDGIEIPKVSIPICQTYTKTRRHDHVCKDLHICKFFMIGRCNKGSGCPFVHDLRHIRNNSVLKSENIDKLPDSIVLELCRQLDNRNWTTLPIVCKFYNNEGACKHGDKCQHLHICKFYIEDDCKFGDACKRNHQFQSSQTRKVLGNFGIEHIQEEEIKIIMQLAVNSRREYEAENGSNSPRESFIDKHFR